MTDPAFDIDGLPDPFDVFFPVLIHNGHSAIVYVGAELVNPPAGWTDGGEDDLGSVALGANLYAEKNNVTRALMGVPANETVTLRLNYYSDAVGGTCIGHDTYSIAIYWESVAGGTVDDTDDFEIDLDGWTFTQESGTTVASGRTSNVSVSGSYSMHAGATGSGADQINNLDVVKFVKSVAIGAGTRAYLFGYMLFGETTRLNRLFASVISPLETLKIPYLPDSVWRRFGVRLTPGTSNEVTIRAKAYNHNNSICLDFLRWVRY